MRHDAGPRLPAALTGTYVLRETTSQDVDAVHSIVVADRTHFTGRCRVPREMTAHLMQPPDGGFSWVVERDGQAVQWWNVAHELGPTAFYSAVTSRPGLLDVDPLLTAGWDAMRAWAVEQLPPGRPGMLRTGRLLDDEAGRRRLEQNGFTPTHLYWAMGGEVPETPAPQRLPPPAGLTIEVATDLRQVHDVMQEGFAEHFGFKPQTFEENLTQLRQRPGFNPSGWYVAAIGGRTAAAMVLSWERATHDVLMVLELATLAWARGRGVGTALLRTAFDVARREGLSRLELLVDSQNDTGAPSLYRSVGLDVLQAMQQFESPLPAPSPQP